MTQIAERGKIMALQESMVALPPEMHVQPDVVHEFAPGIYARTMLIPAGTCIVGKIHRHAHPNNVSLGQCKVVTEFETIEIHAPYQFISEAGTKRVVLALTDVMWTTYHHNPTNTQDLKELERLIIAEDYAALGVEGQA